MKKLTILMAVIGILFSNATKAQFMGDPAITVNGSGSCSSDISVIFYVYNPANCALVGQSNPYALTSGTVVLDYSAISSSVGWKTDPGMPNCSNNVWYFGAADVYDCISTQSTGGTICANGWRDFAHVDDVLCGSSNSTNCFDYSTACACGGPGYTVDITFNASAINGNCAGPFPSSGGLTITVH